MYDVIVKQFTFAISSPDELLVCIYRRFHYASLSKYSLLHHCMTLLFGFTDRSLMAKKADGIKESTDSNATVEEEETRG